MFFICLPSPQHARYLLITVHPLTGTFYFHFLLFFFFWFVFGLDPNLLASVSFHLAPPRSPTDPLRLFSKLHFPHMTVNTSLMISFSTQSWPLHPSSLDLSALFSHISAAFLVSFIALRFRLADCFCLFVFYLSFFIFYIFLYAPVYSTPLFSDLLSVLVLSETVAQAVRASYQPQ